MIRLFNKKTCRHIDIINFLHANQDTISIAKLRDILNVKESVLKSDIEYLNANYSDILRIKTTSSSTMSIHYINNSSIESFFRNIINNSAILNMVKSIFFNNFNSVDDLASALFTSPSTIYRMINKFNISSINKYNFKIDKKSLTFSGMEDNIRSFFIQFFKEKYPFNEWPFETLNRHLITKSIIEYFNVFNSKYEYSYLEVMAWNCAVNIYRANKHFSLLPYLNIDKINNSSTTKLLKSNILRSAFNLFELDFTEENIIEVFYKNVNVNFVHTFEEFTDKANYNKAISISLHRGFSDIYSIKNKYNLKINNIEKLIIRVHNGAVMYNSNIKSNCILYNRYKMYIDKFSSLYPYLVNDVQIYLRNYLTTFKGIINENEVEHLTYILLSTWDSLIPQLHSKSTKLNALIISRFNSLHAYNIKNQLDLFFSYFLDTTLLENNVLQNDSIYNQKYDFIIADFIPKNKQNKKWIYIQEIPSAKNYLELTKMIAEILDSKGFDV
ncbi:helix-turn-helix domain-containing protein [Helcococcus bovis]|uniref:helix-turn-helix domain-containing protein n=1 Tax=Helcococcus bovis TaxID=3153252 RepID=UPI0038BBD848